MTIFIDFETYYDQDYTLKKSTITEYIRDARFEIICVSVCRMTDEPVWFAGTHAEICEQLLEWCPLEDWKSECVVAHNACFDGAILEWVLGIRPHAFFCTMMGARAHIVPFSRGMGLARVAEHLGLGKKGTEVLDAKGLRRGNFSVPALAKYGDYCKNDTALCREIFRVENADISTYDKVLLNLTIQKFIRPQLMLNPSSMVWMLEDEKRRKAKLLETCGILDAKELRSNKKFAELLLGHGVSPPLKISPTTSKETYAFAKTDEEFKALLEHPNPTVSDLVEARMGVKTSLMETRLERFINIAYVNDGYLPWPLLWFGAHTGRLSGYDKLNVQNLPARGNTDLRSAVVAPPGKVVVAGDLSQIEARITAVLAKCPHLICSFAEEVDVYKQFAVLLYNTPYDRIETAQRFVGKTAILGLGFQCGATKFSTMLKQAGVEHTPEFAQETVDTYRQAYPEIRSLWYLCQRMIDKMWELQGTSNSLNVGFATVWRDRIVLPGGRVLYYPELNKDDDTGEYSYETNKRVRTKLYGGKLCENIVQALAQMVIRDVELRMWAAGYVAAGQVHDELIYVVDEGTESEVVNALNTFMTKQPLWITRGSWAENAFYGGEIPLACEINVGKTYADCK